MGGREEGVIQRETVKDRERQTDRLSEQILYETGFSQLYWSLHDKLSKSPRVGVSFTYNCVALKVLYLRAQKRSHNISDGFMQMYE